MILFLSATTPQTDADTVPASAIVNVQTTPRANQRHLHGKDYQPFN